MQNKNVSFFIAIFISVNRLSSDIETVKSFV